MAALESPANTTVAFVSGDSVTFALDHRIPGCQLAATGFDLEDATVTFLPLGSTDPETVALTGCTKSADLSSPGGRVRMTSLTVSGITGVGPFAVGAYQ